MGEARVFGIDFGTSKSRVALYRNFEVEILQNIKSCVFYGAEAKADHAPSDSEITSAATIFNIKRLIGRIESDRVIAASKNLPFMVQTLGIGARPFVAALIDSSWIHTPPSQILSDFMAILSKDYKVEQGKTNVVMTVPVSFTRVQLNMLERACRVSNMNVVTFLPEPTSVAITYADRQLKIGDSQKKIALICNVGAGYCDAAVVQSGNFEVRALAGCCYGGEDILQNMIKFLLPLDFEEEFKNYDMETKVKVTGLLHNAAQAAIVDLTTQMSTEVDLCLENTLSIKKICSRSEFEKFNETVFEKFKNVILQCLGDAKIEVNELDDIILTGGCSNLPKLQRMVSNLCQIEVENFYDGINRFEAAVSGAALVGSGALNFSHFQMVTQSIGVRLDGNMFFPIIARNTKIPVSKKEIFTTSEDWQTEALLVVCEGDDSENRHLLGHFKIVGIPKERRGIPELTVRMAVDDSNVLKVSALVTSPKQVQVPAIQVTMPMLDNCHTGCDEALERICSRGQLKLIAPTSKYT